MRLLRHTDNDIAIHSLEGTIQRVNYRTRELSVIAEGRPWHFALADDSRLWFNGAIAPFRCFQPLDHITVSYADYGSGLIAEALWLWAEEPTRSREQRDWAAHEMDVP